jgi:ABC-2 type transport system ATP-binding protein
VVEFSLNSDASAELTADRFATIPSVISSMHEPDGFLLSVAEPHVAIPALLQMLATERLQLASLTTRHANLEDVFVGLTGRHLSDEQKPAA